MPVIKKSSKSRRITWIVAFLVVVSATAAVGWQFLHGVQTKTSLPRVPNSLSLADVGLEMVQERRAAALQYQNPLSDPSLPSAPQTDPKQAQLQYEAGLALSASNDPGKLTTAAGYLEAAVRSAPANLAYGNALRQVQVKLERYEQMESIWTELDQSQTEVLMQRSLALVDMMQDPNIGAVSAAKLSNQSISLLSTILEKHPYHWYAIYGRGMNELYWPRTFGQLRQAEADFRRALEIQNALPDASAPVFALTYAALGDALVKAGKHAEGRDVWVDGLKRFPADKELRERVNAGPDGAGALVEKIRGVNTFSRPTTTVTDLSVAWAPVR